MTEIAFHPYANLFPMMIGEERESFKQSIRERGQIEDIVLLDGAILDGRNRYTMCRELGLDPRTRVFGSRSSDGEDPLAFVLALALDRRHLDESQRAMVGADLCNLPAHRPAKLGKNNSANLRTFSREQASRIVNVSARTIDFAVVVRNRAILELQEATRLGLIAVSMAAKAAAELDAAAQIKVVERARAGDANAARTVLKKELRARREVALAKRQTALPDRRYGVILADPEWRFEPWSRESGLDRAADNHYPTSDTRAIKARPVWSIAADDCVLFLWATAPMLPDAITVMRAWGFDYKTHAVWAKDRVGTGYWFRSSHELLLVGVRGQPPAPAPGQQWHSLIPAEVGRHSEKPEIFYQLIESLFPTLPKIELNARRTRPGWDAWGNEAPDHPQALEAAE